MSLVCGEDRLLAVHVAALAGFVDVIRIFVEKDERCLIAASSVTRLLAHQHS